MRKHIQLWACASTVAILVACGGGSDGETTTTSTAAVDKYLGSWSTACQLLQAPGANPTNPNGLSEFEFVTFTKVSDAQLSGAGVETQYDSTDCSGPVKSVTNYTLSVALSGAVVIAADVADKLLIDTAGVLDKTIALVTGGRMYFGSSIPLDTDGYPTTIDPNWYLTKQ